jgi:hypothetical protein
MASAARSSTRANLRLSEEVLVEEVVGTVIGAVTEKGETSLYFAHRRFAFSGYGLFKRRGGDKGRV